MLKPRQNIKPTILTSFWFAIRGLGYTVISQKNMQIHLVIGLLALVLGVYFRISTIEVMLLTISIWLVLITEAINTAIEISVDLVTKKWRVRAMLSKDIAAGAVLLAAFNSIIIGSLIFIPKFITLIHGA